MRTRFWGVAASAIVASLALASPAMAHGGHRSCAPAAHGFIVPLAHSGLAGETASTQARAGTLNENVALSHALLCEPSS